MQIYQRIFTRLQADRVFARALEALRGGILLQLLLLLLALRRGRALCKLVDIYAQQLEVEEAVRVELIFIPI